MKKYIRVGLYLLFSVFFMFATYLSVFHTPDMRATILLGVFCIMPLGFIDRPARMNVFVAFWLLVHTILSFHFKPQLDADDLVNCLAFAILGCFIGNKMVRVRVENYEAHRLLTIEKETDVLTGLLNRRKLYETLILLETTNAENPIGIMMIDIDHFKELNDRHGHAMGDKYLNRLGEELTRFSQDFRLAFYRYGGEEFVGLAYGYDVEELMSIAERIRVAVQKIDIDGVHTTVSIGIAYSGDESVQNYENIIDRADQAVYEAKSQGRNRICLWNKLEGGCQNE